MKLSAKYGRIGGGSLAARFPGARKLSAMDGQVRGACMAEGGLSGTVRSRPAREPGVRKLSATYGPLVSAKMGARVSASPKVSPKFRMMERVSGAQRSSVKNVELGGDMVPVHISAGVHALEWYLLDPWIKAWPCVPANGPVAS